MRCLQTNLKCRHVEVTYYVAHVARSTLVLMATGTCCVTRAYVRDVHYVEQRRIFFVKIQVGGVVVIVCGKCSHRRLYVFLVTVGVCAHVRRFLLAIVDVRLSFSPLLHAYVRRVARCAVSVRNADDGHRALSGGDSVVIVLLCERW